MSLSPGLKGLCPVSPWAEGLSPGTAWPPGVVEGSQGCGKVAPGWLIVDGIERKLLLVLHVGGLLLPHWFLSPLGACLPLQLLVTEKADK